MHPLEHRILTNFKKDPNRQFSTTDIVRAVFPAEYEEIRNHMLKRGSDHEAVLLAGRRKAELHRRILYHLNKLVNEEILQAKKHNTQKVFSLKLESGDYVLERGRRRVIINKPQVLALEAFGKEQIATIFDKETWISRVNSVMINAEAVSDLGLLYNLTAKSFSYVNDCIGISGFEQLLQKSSFEDVKIFIDKICLDIQDYQRTVTLNIDLAKINDEVRIIEFICYCCESAVKEIVLVFAAEPYSLRKNRRALAAIIRLFSSAKRKIYIQNSEQHRAPYIVGNAGIYTFGLQEWNKQLQQTCRAVHKPRTEHHLSRRAAGYEPGLDNQNTQIVICGQTSVLIDLQRFLKQKRLHELDILIMELARSLFAAARIQRLHSSSYFLELNRISEPESSKLYALGQNYIRICNYNLQNPKQEGLIELLNRCQVALDLYSRKQEAVYRACGIPIRFRIALAGGFGKSCTREYKKKTIRKTQDFNSPEFASEIANREQLFKVFRNADRLRIFRAGCKKSILNEFLLILKSKSIPLFCYDFEDRKGEMSLEQFLV